MVEEWLKKNFCLLPPSFSMHHGDAEMSTPWDDDDNWIEDRWTRGELFQRRAAGYWAGDERALTWVLPIGAALNTPPPTSRGFQATARTSPRVVDTSTSLAGLGTRNGTAPPQADQQKLAPDTSSTSSSDRHRDQGVDRQREDMLRYQALSTRDRFHDEPVWGGRRPRYDPRNSR
ncbi:hypothetical protein DFH06DRAFT_1142424 [Mycena polygramma]|nr:hypothetical protein DFH06DRAFT_1142424 [Mycena polygramma]